jgi:hypothetical protein
MSEPAQPSAAADGQRSVGLLTRLARFGWGADDHRIASVEALSDRVEELCRTTGRSRDEASEVVVEDLERAAATLTTRTAPMVPAVGILVALSGLLVKAEPSSGHPVAEAFVGLAIFFAIAGFSFLTRALFLYAGRRVIGLSADFEDIAYARARLVIKRTSAHRGAVLAGLGLTCLIIGILVGVHISIS